MIDPKTQAELRAKYNPEGSLLRQHQLRMVEMLKYFDELCQKHGIRYWLSSGNCIGLVRHGGFIPWDDDVDVEMLRKDYLKLEKVFKETEDYVLQTWKNDKGYFRPYAKMRDKHSFLDEGTYDKYYDYRGVFIDVFYLEKSNRVIYFLSSGLKRIFKKYVGKKYFNYIKKIIFATVPIFRFLSFLLPKNKLRHTYINSSKLYSKVRDINDIFPLKRVYFEGIQVNVPNNLDAYLKKIYGDYMSIPPVDKIRESHVKGKLKL